MRRPAWWSFIQNALPSVCIPVIYRRCHNAVTLIMANYSTGLPEKQSRYRVSGVRARLHRLLKQHHEEEYNRVFKAEWTGLARSWKIPLLRCGSDAVLLNQHDGTMAPPDNVRLALAHFKFTPDLDSKISYALSSKANNSDSVEYLFLKSALQHFENLSLLGPESVEFEDVSSLEFAGHVFLN